MTHAGGSVYLCRHQVCQSPGTPFMAQSPAALYSHVRCKHLGVALACPYCQQKLYWNSRGWKNHMTQHHKEVPHYGSALVDEPKEAARILAGIEEEPSVPPTEASAPVPPFRSPGHAARGGLIKRKRRPAHEVESSSSSSSEDSFPDSTSSSCDSEGSDTSLQSTKQDPAVEGSGYTPPQHEAIKEGAVALKGQATLEALQQHKSALKQPTTAIVATRDLTNQPPLAQELAVGLVVGDLPPLGEAMEDPLDDMPELETTPPRPFPKKPKLDKE